jgi:alpha-amylase/alpha-mannosidase (GH57 family)
MVVNKYICIHGHFYQPPRINPWLEALEVQDSAAPYHDWNRRVNAECYAPNASARITGPGGTIANIINNYEWISFNFGPTLLSWMEEHSPEVHEAIVEADRLSVARYGKGNALAQVYNHIIMPLASQRDKQIQVRWGLRDFERRFGRKPEGMWLSETAVDTPSLEVLAEEGIVFTILAPRQAGAVRPLGAADWHEGGEQMDPRRPYLVNLPSGRSIAVFIYDGPLSQAVAFERLLTDGARFADRLRGQFDSTPADPQLLSIATDGESYGHHHRFGEMGLAFALNALNQDPEVELINYAGFLQKHPPSWELRIVENSSWSCAHGVERWRSNCGCAANPDKGWSQAWRTPLRDGLNQVKAGLDELFERVGGELFADPWQALVDYAAQLRPQAGQPPASYFETHAKKELSHKEKIRAVKLLESQRWGHMMFTSCGWFFDDIAGLEPVQNLRFAARALELARDLGAEGLEQGLLSHLDRAQSNNPLRGSGRRIWARMVDVARVGPERALAHAALAGLVNGADMPDTLYCWRLEVRNREQKSNLGIRAAWGYVCVRHARIQEEHCMRFGALHLGGHEFHAFVAHDSGDEFIDSLEHSLADPLRRLDRQGLMRVMDQQIGGGRFGLGDLFLEGRRDLAGMMLQRSQDELHQVMARYYAANKEALIYLNTINVPLPPEMEELAAATLREELIQGIRKSGPGSLPPGLAEAAQQALAMGLDMNSHRLRHSLESALSADLAGLDCSNPDQGLLVHAGEVLALAAALDIELNIWDAQNRFERLVRRCGKHRLAPELGELGRKLNFDLSESLAG